MKSFSKKFAGISLAVMLLLPLLPLFSLPAAAAEADAEQVDILFLHDTHSHLDSFPTVEGGQNVTLGGFARIKTLIDEKREGNPDALLLDAGDFSMGTLVQTIFHTDAPELRMLGYLGCEVSTFGNHEFDYRSVGLAGALEAAAESGDPVPALALCNVDWEAMEAEGLTEDQRLLKEAFTAYGVEDYVMLDKGGIRIAVLGVFGEDSLACAPTCALKFRDISEAAADTVKEIRENEDADMIVCVSHSGTSQEADKSEDEILAKAVPEIDLIVSGHTHTSLYEPIRHGDTYIVSCGSYGRNLGSLSMTRQADGRWQMDSYELIPVTQDIQPDGDAQAKIDSLKEKIDATYLARFGYTTEQVLARNGIEFATSDDLYETHTEHNLGNLLADSFAYAAAQADDPDDHPIDVAIVPSGCVRDTFATGDVTVTDVFNAYSLGIGPDGIPGYPLISMYLTGAELKTGAEIDASVSDFMKSARLYISGLHFTFNPHRIILNKVTDCYMVDENGSRAEIEDDKLYRVVCDLYSGQMLGAVTDVSYGILSVQPKFVDGTPIEDIEDAIITDGGRELKAWAAIAGYLDSLEDADGDGVSDIPEAYASAQGRKVIEDSRAIGDLVKSPNKFAFIILGIIALLLALIVLLLWLLIKLVRRLTGRSARRKGKG